MVIVVEPLSVVEVATTLRVVLTVNRVEVVVEEDCDDVITEGTRVEVLPVIEVLPIVELL